MYQWRFLCWYGEQFSLLFFEVTMKSFLLRWGTVHLCLVRCNNAEFCVQMGIIMQIFLLRWRTVQLCLFRCNNAEVCVQMGNGSVCWDGERFSLSFCNVNRCSIFYCATRLEWSQSFRLGEENYWFSKVSWKLDGYWRTVLSCLFRCNDADFFVDMGNSSVLSFWM